MLPTMEIVLPPAAPGTSNVPAFLAKLWKMVDDPSTNHLISWSAEGTSFIIHNQAEFASSLLPYYYKHSNMASFVRQLNMYGFHKIVGIDSGGLKSEKQEEMEFAHTYFIRGMEMLLEKIKRKVSSNKAAHYVPSLKTERVNEMLNEVSIIRERQEDLDSKLDTMKKENEALWREVVSLRQKHQSQQKIVNKLIQFLVSMVQPRAMNQAVKRRFPQQLAIEESSTQNNKEMRLEGATSKPAVTSNNGSSSVFTSSGHLDLGPIISDVTQDGAHEATLTQANSGDNDGMAGLGEVFDVEMPDTPDPISVTSTGAFSIKRPNTPITSAAMMAVDPSLVSPGFHQPSANNNQKATKKATLDTKTRTTSSPQSKGATVRYSPKRPLLQREISKEDFDLETNVNQKDLDSLKEVLSGQITVDPNFLTNLFNPDEPFLFYPNTSDLPTSSLASSGSVTTTAAAQHPGKKLQLELGNNTAVSKYQPTSSVSPSLFELVDIDGGNPVSVPVSSASSNEEASNTTGGIDDAAILNTPKVLVDEIDPLVASLKK